MLVASLPDHIRKQVNNGGGRNSEKKTKARERPIARKMKFIQTREKSNTRNANKQGR